LAEITTGGWAPLGRETEDGPAHWLAEFGLVECPEPGYPARIVANIRDRLWLLARRRKQTVSAVADDLLNKALPRWDLKRLG
jgi:Circularly permutated YpsA SLOG family